MTDTKVKEMCTSRNISITNNNGKLKYMNIEFLRIIAILAILMLHIFHSGMGLHRLGFDVHLYDKLYKMTGNGQKGVEFFFILAGLFFYLGMAKDSALSLYDFIRKKIIRMWPVMAWAVLLAFILSLFGVLKFYYWDNIYALLFLNGTALQGAYGNISPSWYCSVMLFHFVLFFYLYKNMPEKWFWFVVCIGIYISYGIILQAKGYKINNPFQSFGYIFNVSMLRAWGGIGIGMLLGLWHKNCAEKIAAYQLNIGQKILLSAMEFVLLYFMINNLMLHKFQHHNQFMFIIVFTALIGCFLMNKGYISALFNREIFPKMSKYIYSIFITHQVVIGLLRRNLWKPHHDLVENYPVINMVGTFLAIIIVGVLTYYLVEKPAAKYLRKKWFGK
ncbi:MAG: acyltransferase family protein [Alphaproteobacteria bacterium]